MYTEIGRIFLIRGKDVAQTSVIRRRVRWREGGNWEDNRVVDKESGGKEAAAGRVHGRVHRMQPRQERTKTETQTIDR